MHLRKYTIIFKTLAIFLLLAMNSYAQETDVKIKLHDDNYLTKPHLNGHSFMNLSSIKSPFINTSLNITIGAGQTMDFELPPIQVDTFTINTVKGEVAYSLINLEYQGKLRDWIALWAKFQLNGRLGTKLRSVLSQGVNLSTGYEFGWLFKLWENKQNMLSGAIKVSNSNFTVIDLKTFIEKVIESGKITEDNVLFQSVPSLSFAGELRHAIAINKSLGLSSFAEFGVGESINRDEGTQSAFILGVAAEYDLLPKSDIPLGFSLGYFQNSIPKLADERLANPQNVISKISYTGSRDLNAGIEISYEWSKPESSGGGNEISLKFINIYGNFRYYF